MIHQNLIDGIQNQPLVSVGIPTYNRPDGLKRTLECITGQTYKNLEIIVSDNCSPGRETDEVVREFMARDDRILYFRQDTNMGPSFNFQFVLEKARGEYFMWAADDDDRTIEHIELLIKPLLLNNNILSISRWHHIYPNDEIFTRNWPSMSIVGRTNYDTFINFLKSPHWGWDKACFIYGLMRSDIIKKVRMNDVISLKIGNDIVTLLELLGYGNFSYTDAISWSYRYGYPKNIPLFNKIKSNIYKLFIIFKYCFGYSNNTIKECEKFYEYVDNLILTHFNGSKYARILNLIYKYRIIYLLH